METTVLKCPGCGCALPFDAQIGKWRCEACGSVYSEQDIFILTKDSDQDVMPQEVTPPPLPDNDPYGQQPELNVYRCKNCGAEMVADDTCAATFCVYCGSTSILKGRLEGEFRPSRLIPFAKTKDDAINAFKGLMSQENFVPSDFTNVSNIEKITGVYIPFWLYSGDVQGYVSGRLRQVKTWMSGNYKYTQTDIYDVERAGSVAFDSIPADGSKKFDDDTMDSIEPFDLSKLVPFNYSYLSGFLAEKYDVTAEEDQERAASRMKNTIIHHIDSTINGVLENRRESVREDIKNVEYVLLPVWMLNTFYKGKPYIFAMNGQTGKLVGDVPIAWGKWFRCFFITFAVMAPVAWAIIKLFNYLMD